MQISMSWAAFKAKGLPIRYVASQGNFYLFAAQGSDELTCVISASGANGADFVANYQSGAESLT